MRLNYRIGAYMNNYRMYYLDPHDTINGVWEIESICDETAISAAKRKASGQLFELWARDRLVFRENITPASAS